MQDSPIQIDKRRVRASFDRAAAEYDAAAVIQREIADRTLERLDVIRLMPGTVLDVGAGTGYCSRALAERYPKSRVVLADVAPRMLQHARAEAGLWNRLRQRYVYLGADAEALPLADASVDLLFSNLTLQWCVDLDRAFREFRRVLTPGGLLMFTTFGPDTLKELRECWSRVDGFTHTNAFVDMHDIGDALVRAQFADPVMDMEYLSVTYRDALDLMRDLKQIGAHNATAGRARGLTGRGRLRQVIDAYERYRQDGVLPATHEVVYGHAWAPEQGVVQHRDGDETTISLGQLRSGLRR